MTKPLRIPSRWRTNDWRRKPGESLGAWTHRLDFLTHGYEARDNG